MEPAGTVASTPVGTIRRFPQRGVRRRHETLVAFDRVRYLREGKAEDYAGKIGSGRSARPDLDHTAQYYCMP